MNGPTSSKESIEFPTGDSWKLDIQSGSPGAPEERAVKLGLYKGQFEADFGKIMVVLSGGSNTNSSPPQELRARSISCH